MSGAVPQLAAGLQQHQVPGQQTKTLIHEELQEALRF
jgi:hypothetical protein